MKSVLIVRIVIFRDVFHPIVLNYTLNVRCYNSNSRNVSPQFGEQYDCNLQYIVQHTYVFHEFELGKTDAVI